MSENKINKKYSHIFSIELTSRDSVKRLIIPIEDDASILIEGFLGDIKDAGIIEGVMLEINGTNGTLKMDITEEELLRIIRRPPK